MKKQRIAIVTLVAALAAALCMVPLAASADRDHRLVIGVRVDFTSSTHADGTFAVCCAVDDGGAARADVTSFVPRGDGIATFEATETFTGAKGTVTLGLQGTTGPLDSDRHVARGQWTVTGGTGAYAALRGRGTFTAVTDETTGALTGINEGRVHGARD